MERSKDTGARWPRRPIIHKRCWRPCKLTSQNRAWPCKDKSNKDLTPFYLTDCLEKGIKSGEFNRIPVPETVNLLIAMINGLFRQRGLHPEEKDGMRDVTIDFCKRSLVKM